jgi:hypothetical protein
MVITIHIVMHMTIARQWLGKQSRSYALNNRSTSICRQKNDKRPYEMLRDGVFLGIRPEDI